MRIDKILIATVPPEREHPTYLPSAKREVVWRRKGGGRGALALLKRTSAGGGVPLATRGQVALQRVETVGKSPTVPTAQSLKPTETVFPALFLRTREWTRRTPLALSTEEKKVLGEFRRPKLR